MSKFVLTFTSKKDLVVNSSEDKECENMQNVADSIVEYLSKLEKENSDCNIINISLKRKFTLEGKDHYIEVVDKNLYMEDDNWIDYKDVISGMIGQIVQQLWLAKNQDKLKILQGGMMGMPNATESGLIL